MRTRYITVDMEIGTRGSLDCLKSCFSDEDVLFDIFKNDEDKSFVNASLTPESSPSECILNCIRIIQSGGEASSSELEASHYKYFNVGFDVSKDDWAFQSKLTPECIQKCSKLGFGIAITLYPMNKYD